MVQDLENAAKNIVELPTIGIDHLERILKSSKRIETENQNAAADAMTAIDDRITVDDTMVL